MNYNMLLQKFINSDGTVHNYLNSALHEIEFNCTEGEQSNYINDFGACDRALKSVLPGATWKLTFNGINYEFTASDAGYPPWTTTTGKTPELAVIHMIIKYLATHEIDIKVADNYSY